jgi:hypothetical protein
VHKVLPLEQLWQRLKLHRELFIYYRYYFLRHFCRCRRQLNSNFFFSFLLQITAETAYDMVSPGPSVRRRINRKGKRKRIHPPQVFEQKSEKIIKLLHFGFFFNPHRIFVRVFRMLTTL